MGAATFTSYETDRQNQIKADAAAKKIEEEEQAAKSIKGREAKAKAMRNARIKPDKE